MRSLDCFIGMENLQQPSCCRSLRKGSNAGGFPGKEDVMLVSRWRNVGAAAEKGKGTNNDLVEETVLVAEGTVPRGNKIADTIR